MKGFRSAEFRFPVGLRSGLRNAGARRTGLYTGLMRTILFALSVIVAMPADFRAEEPAPQSDEEGVRLKDLARIQGVRTNQLLGYGIVVGLPGTGDTRSTLASTSIQNLLGNLGQNFSEKELGL